MLDFADFVAINKFDRKGAADALRDVRKQYQRNRELWKTPPEEMPVFGTMASRFNDDGVTALYQALAARLAGNGLKLARARLAPRCRRGTRRPATAIVPGARVRYLAEIAEAVRDVPPLGAASRAAIARERQQLAAAQGDARGRRRRQDGRRRPTLRRSTHLHRRARGEARRRARRSSSTCGRRPRRPTAATSTW